MRPTERRTPGCLHRDGCSSSRGAAVTLGFARKREQNGHGGAAIGGIDVHGAGKRPHALAHAGDTDTCLLSQTRFARRHTTTVIADFEMRTVVAAVQANGRGLAFGVTMNVGEAFLDDAIAIDPWSFDTAVSSTTMSVEKRTEDAARSRSTISSTALTNPRRLR